MKLSLALATTFALSVNAVDPSVDPAPPGMSIVYGNGYPGFSEEYTGSCQPEARRYFQMGRKNGSFTAAQCDAVCRQNLTPGLLGFNLYHSDGCDCIYNEGTLPITTGRCGNFDSCYERGFTGQGPLGPGNIYSPSLNGDACYRYTISFEDNDNEDTTQNTESTGDPHFRTWKDEHFEFHGQCDLVMTTVKNFAGQGIDLDIHLRTSMVRYWSYIKTAAIRIGDDILEVEGSAAKEDGIAKRHYHINFEYRGPLETLGGFPVTINPNNDIYTIDLGSKFPGQKILIKTFKEFVGVKIVGANHESFGKAVGITGNFHTGKTLGRDGHTEINDFTDLGLEWQVLPSDGKLFHEVSKPQFPELCYLPEDPRGDRARRLDESSITEEQAEEACAGLKDEFDRKGCIYDILATQDLDMVGAY